MYIESSGFWIVGRTVVNIYLQLLNCCLSTIGVNKRSCMSTQYNATRKQTYFLMRLSTASSISNDRSKKKPWKLHLKIVQTVLYFASQTRINPVASLSEQANKHSPYQLTKINCDNVFVTSMTPHRVQCSAACNLILHLLTIIVNHFPFRT